MALRHPICAGSSPTTRHTGAVGARPRPTSLPGDDAVLMGRTVAAAAATVGLGLALTGSVLRLRGLPDVFSVPPTLLDQVPRLRRHLEQRIGPEGTDLLFGFVNASTAALTLSPTAAAAEAATRAMLAAEAEETLRARPGHLPGALRPAPHPTRVAAGVRRLVRGRPVQRSVSHAKLAAPASAQ